MFVHKCIDDAALLAGSFSGQLPPFGGAAQFLELLYISNNRLTGKLAEGVVHFLRL